MKIFVACLAAALTASPASAAFTAQPFQMRNGPVVWTAQGADTLTISAGPKTNWFVPPWNPKGATDSAPTLLFKASADFSLSAKVHLTPRGRWDAGALTVFADKDHWAKLCLENADGDGKLAVVMVVNNIVSDDSYTTLVAPGDTLMLRISRKGPAFTFHASADGKSWRMLRTFALGGDLADLRMGLLAQSPAGDGISVVFSDLRYEPAP